MKIGVVSDTHGRPLPQQLLKEFATVDLIVHAGDLCDWDNYKQLSNLAEVQAVAGNMDGEEIRKKLPSKLILECEGVRIGVFHGDGPPKTLLQHVQHEFESEHLDVVIFGHSHEPFNEMIDGILFFNPGSPNDEIFAPYCSYGLLQIKGKKASGSIVRVNA